VHACLFGDFVFFWVTVYPKSFGSKSDRRRETGSTHVHVILFVCCVYVAGNSGQARARTVRESVMWRRPTNIRWLWKPLPAETLN
jgi:hypothetical protein